MLLFATGDEIGDKRVVPASEGKAKLAKVMLAPDTSNNFPPVLVSRLMFVEVGHALSLE